MKEMVSPESVKGELSLLSRKSQPFLSHLSLVYTMSVSYLLLAVCILVDNLFFLVSKCNLHCTVSIVLYCLDLCYRTWTCFQYSNRY